MPSKKPLPTPPSTKKPSTLPQPGKRLDGLSPNPRQQPDNRWQRTKRFGWDSR